MQFALEKIDQKNKDELKKKMDSATDMSPSNSETVKKVQEVSNQINGVVNSPEANIIGDIVGGKFQDKLKSIQGVVNSTNHAVNTFAGSPP